MGAPKFLPLLHPKMLDEDTAVKSRTPHETSAKSCLHTGGLILLVGFIGVLIWVQFSLNSDPKLESAPVTKSLYREPLTAKPKPTASSLKSSRNPPEPDMANLTVGDKVWVKRYIGDSFKPPFKRKWEQGEITHVTDIDDRDSRGYSNGEPPYAIKFEDGESRNYFT